LAGLVLVLRASAVICCFRARFHETILTRMSGASSSERRQRRSRKLAVLMAPRPSVVAIRA